MNTLRKILPVLTLGLVIILTTACEKTEDENPAAANGTAFIMGKVEANLDLRNDTLPNGNPGPAVLERVPAGTKIFARFNTIDLVLNPVPGANYAIQTLTTSVDANGDYRFEIPANSKNVNVTVVPEDFIHTIILTDSTTLDNQKFQSGGNAVTVFNGITEYSNIVYIP